MSAPLQELMGFQTWEPEGRGMSPDCVLYDSGLQPRQLKVCYQLTSHSVGVGNSLENPIQRALLKPPRIKVLTVA